MQKDGFASWEVEVDMASAPVYQPNTKVHLFPAQKSFYLRVLGEALAFIFS